MSNGEENEDIIFKMRAKIYRWREDEWKERGTGIMKLLRNKQNYKIRFIMRQEKTLKVVANFFGKRLDYCLNSNLVSDLPMMCILTPLVNDDRAYTWRCTDYSELHTGKEELFALKLQTVESKSF